MLFNIIYMVNVGENFEIRLVELLLNFIKKEYGGYFNSYNCLFCNLFIILYKISN